jgi:hypothetical protein
MHRLVALLTAVALLLPVSVVVRACFCEHENGALGHDTADCTCPLHGGAPTPAEAPAGAHCPLHARQAAAGTEAAGEVNPAEDTAGARCAPRPGPEEPSAGVLAALATLLRPAVLDTAAAPVELAVAGRLAPPDPAAAAAEAPRPPTPPPRATSRFA